MLEQSSEIDLENLGASVEPCPYDAIYVYDQSSLKDDKSQPLGIFCGVYDEDKLPEVQSKTNVMYVTFVTDSSSSNEGFVGEVSFTYGEYNI